MLHARSERPPRTGPRRLFDHYLAVDWSASSRPTARRPREDALWVGERAADGQAVGERYWRTRAECLAWLRSRLLELTAGGRRVFLGFDFAYAYPAGLAGALGLPEGEEPWRRVWTRLSALGEGWNDDPGNRNTRFAAAAALNEACGGAEPGPFWGCPAGRGLPLLRPTKPPFPYRTRSGIVLEERRLAEDHHARGGIQPVWKIFYTASVGGQALTGIPAVASLRDDPALAPYSRVWPFETGFTPSPTPERGPFVLHAEIWPSAIPGPLDPELEIRDQAQVRNVVSWLAEQDAAGELGRAFDRPAGLGEAEVRRCIEEEGWIVGRAD